jgi:hypothetical protein
MIYDCEGPGGVWDEDGGRGRDIVSFISISGKIMPWFIEDKEGGWSRSGMIISCLI